MEQVWLHSAKWLGDSRGRRTDRRTEAVIIFPSLNRGDKETKHYIPFRGSLQSSQVVSVKIEMNPNSN